MYYLNLFLIGMIILVLYNQIEGLYYIYEMNYKKEKSIWKALKKTVLLIIWIGYLIVYQKVTKNMIIVKKNEYDVHYIYHGQLYKIKCKHISGPKYNQVLMITNQDSEDITTDILPYMGPKYNFHNIHYTPKDFNNQELSFYLSTGHILKFINNDIICLS
jgi:hypothetical protein